MIRKKFTKGSRKGFRHNQNKADSAIFFFRMAVFVTILIIVSIFLLFYFRSPLSSEERITLVWETDPVWVTTYHQNSGILGIVRLPSDTYVEVPGGFGWYRIGVLWKLGKIEKKGARLLVSSIQNFLGVPIDGWVVLNDSPLTVDGRGNEVLSKLTESIVPYKGVKGNSLAGYSFIDRLILWWKLKKIDPANIVFVDLANEQVFTDKTLADGTKAQIGDPELVDKVSQRIFWEEFMRNEKLVFRIYNGSQIGGFGNDVARIISNMGLHVVAVANAELRTECEIRTPKGTEGKRSIRRLKKIFHCQVTEDKNSGNEVSIYLSGSEMQ